MTTAILRLRQYAADHLMTCAQRGACCDTARARLDLLKSKPRQIEISLPAFLWDLLIDHQKHMRDEHPEFPALTLAEFLSAAIVQDVTQSDIPLTDRMLEFAIDLNRDERWLKKQLGEIPS